MNSLVFWFNGIQKISTLFLHLAAVFHPHSISSDINVKHNIAPVIKDNA
jgi:hypothetical protein